jgi:hypothetical protein
MLGARFLSVIMKLRRLDTPIGYSVRDGAGHIGRAAPPSRLILGLLWHKSQLLLASSRNYLWTRGFARFADTDRAQRGACSGMCHRKLVLRGTVNI